VNECVPKLVNVKVLLEGSFPNILLFAVWLHPPEYVVVDDSAERLRQQAEAVLRRRQATRHSRNEMMVPADSNDVSEEQFPFVEKVLQVDVKDTIAGSFCFSPHQYLFFLASSSFFLLQMVNNCTCDTYIYVCVVA
jgi:hypothetical protein